MGWQCKALAPNHEIQVRQTLQFSDLSGIDVLLGAYGGMGSFNDLSIGQKFLDSNFIDWKDESDEKNKLLDLLQEEAYDVATEIKRIR